MPSMRMNTQPPSARFDDGGWQTVGEPKAKSAKLEVAAAQKKAPAANGGAGNNAPRPPQKQPELYQGTSSVLAELDKQWAKQQRKQAQVQDHMDANAFEALDHVDARKKTSPPLPQTLSPADSAADSPTRRVARPAKPARAKKEKSEKATAPEKAAKPRADASVKSLAAEVDVDGFQEFVASLEAKHAADEVLQLQCVCDFLRSVFATARMQFSTMLQTMPMAAVADEPWAALPGALRQALSRFVGSKQPAALADYLCQACEAIVTGLPERGAGGPPAKVEVLVMVAAILRTRPAAALLPACDTLSKMGVRMLAPGRLPTTMWVLEQAAHVSGPQGVGSAVHSWCRVILPALVLAELPSSSSKKAKSEKVGGYQLEAGSREAAIDYLLTLLARPGLPEAAAAGLDTMQPGKPLEAVVPSSAVVEIAAALHSESRRPGMSRETPALLQRIEPQLRVLALATPVEHHLTALLVKCLEGAESCSEDALGEHAALLVALLAAHPVDTAALWSSKHKIFIGGSTRVLQHLAASRTALAPLLAAPEGHAVLIAALDQIAAKQATLVKSAKASAARKAARDAQAAIDALVAANSVQAGGSSALLSLTLLLVAAAAVPVLIDRNPDVARKYLSGLLGAETADGVVKYCAQLVFCLSHEVPKLFTQARESFEGLRMAKHAK